MGKLHDAPCTHCKVISPHNGKNQWGRIRIPYNRVDQYPNFPALGVSAEKGCAFCGLLRYSLQDKYSDEKIADAESDFHPSIRATWPNSGWDGQVTIAGAVFYTEEDWAERDASQALDQALGGIHNLSLDVWPYPPRRGVIRPELTRSWLSFAVYADPGSDASLQGISSRRKPDEEALSSANVALISKWLGICSTSHTECRQKSDAQLPTRLIDVGPPDGSQEPRLIVTSKNLGNYVALSHCWGSLMSSDTGKYARTLKINLKGMQRGIPLDMLPQNFQDAILTVRKLQLRYLWIDALCIVQDDTADWAKEAARMNDVYGSAYLTIAATSSMSSTDGFLKRPQESVCSVPYKKIIRTEPTGCVFLACMRMDADQGSWYFNVEKARWNTRGWTFQERLLSKRVLHFAERKMFWECRMADTSEENEPPRDPRYRTSWLKGNGLDESVPLPKQNAGTSNSHFDVWYSIVSMYSTREFSYEIDVFPALSGLAHAFKDLHGIGNFADDGDYLAGIWRDDLSRGLLWTPHDSSHTTRHIQYVAPTWSWASIKGQIRFPSGDLDGQSTARFVSASLEKKADDPLGAIRAARLSLLAKIRRLCEVARKASSSWFPLHLRFEGKTIGHGAFDVNSEGCNDTVWVMECMLQKPWDYRDHPTVLLLQRSGSTPNTYERVGVGKMDEDSLGFFNDCEPQEIALM